MRKLPESLGPKLLMLKERFLEALPQRISDLATTLDDYASAAEPGRLDEVERRFHTIAGTAGTYGVHDVAALAAEGEEVCAAGVIVPGDAARIGRLRSLVESMRSALSEEQAGETGPVGDLKSSASSPAALLVSRQAGSLSELASRLRAEGFSVVTTSTVASAKTVVERAMPEVVVSDASAPRVLCVEDDPDQADYVEAILRGAGYSVWTIADPTTFESTLTTFRPDLIVMDIGLPDLNGVDLARYVREDVANATLPIVFLTGERKMESRMTALGVGGDDYLTKPVAPELLLSVVASRLKRSRSLKALIDLDGLTGVLTHAAFMRRAQTIAAETRRRPEPVALVMLDLDHFKSVNDRFGHLAGDRVLTSFSSFLRRNLRAGDEVGRYGGEEFAMLLRNISAGEVQGLVARLVVDFGAIPHCSQDGSTFYVTFSAGVAMYESGCDLQEWKQRADEALYAAKHLGRARVEAA